MTQVASDTTLAFVFSEVETPVDGLTDPFLEQSCLDQPATRDQSKSETRDSQSAKQDGDEDASDSATYTFRWDVEVPLAEHGKCGGKFMRQWKRVLQAQKLSPLVSPKLTPQGARFQLCMLGLDQAKLIAEREREIMEELAHLRQDALPIAGEPVRTHPAGWEGVRVWMTFARRDVESALVKKAKV